MIQGSKRIMTIVLLSIVCISCRRVETPPPPHAPAKILQEGESLHSIFDSYLKKYVRNGVVDYSGMKAEIKTLNSYVSILNTADPSTMKSNEERMAFWINAYNAFTLQLILSEYPSIKSIKDIPSARRWKWKGWYVNNIIYSLDQIEHEILRKMGDPRIHFAIVCASISCPDLASDAYEANALDAQLSMATKAFLSDEAKGLTFNIRRGTFGTNYNVSISKIFSWFDEDFINTSGSVEAFLELYAPEEAVTFLRTHKGDVSLAYLDYNWNLNGK